MGENLSSMITSINSSKLDRSLNRERKRGKRPRKIRSEIVPDKKKNPIKINQRIKEEEQGLSY